MYPEPPLPPELQQEIEASCDRFRTMFPVFLKTLAEEYVPKYRAEITALLRRASSFSEVRTKSLSDCHLQQNADGSSYLIHGPSATIMKVFPVDHIQRAETPVQRETHKIEEA